MTTAAPAVPGAAVIRTLVDYTARLEDERAAGRTVGVVLTMGALHTGHVSLIRRAAAECDVVAVSVFVNPTQFSDPSDLDRYPRQLDTDRELARAAGASLVFAPSTAEMYPESPARPATTVTVRGLTDRWEGVSRPGHFDGVATVVVKLLSTSGRCRTYFGEKDFQQLAIVRQVVRDLSLPVEVVGCATVREPDGLAMSSRNQRLAPDERRAARCLWRALSAGSAALIDGADCAETEDIMAAEVGGEPLVALDYAAVVRAVDLEPAGPGRPATEAGPFRLLIAAHVGPVRLIDNLDPFAPA